MFLEISIVIRCINCENLETIWVLFSQNLGISFALLVHYLGATWALLVHYLIVMYSLETTWGLLNHCLGTAWVLLSQFCTSWALLGFYFSTTQLIRDDFALLKLVKILRQNFGQEFEVEFCSRLVLPTCRGWSLVESLKLSFGQKFEAKFWSRFFCWNLINLQCEPLGPLCPWQCF